MDNMTNLISMVSGWEFIFYIPLLLITFALIFHVELSYAERVKKQYNYSFFSAFWYAQFIPDKYIVLERYNLDVIRTMEFILSGKPKPEITVRSAYTEMYFGTKNSRYRTHANFYFSESGSTIVDGSPVLLTPPLLIELLCLYDELDVRTSKKNMLT